MKNIRKFLVLVIMCFCFIPMVNAETESFEFTAGDNVTSDSEVSGSSMLAGLDVTGTNNIKGIGMLFGNNVTFDGIADYSLLAGNNVKVNGIINNDGFIFGNIIEFSEEFNIDRDLFIFGNDVILNGTINRDVRIFASSVTIDGVIDGDVTISASKINIDSPTIGGTLSYNEDADVTTNNNSNIANTVLTEKLTSEVTYKNQILSSIISLAGILVTYIAFALIVPGLFTRIDKKNDKISVFKALSLTGFGALTLIAVPVIAMLLFSFVFGYSLALVLIAFYILTLGLSSMFSGYLLGSVVWDKFIKKDRNLLLVGLLGIIIIFILNLIPIIGTITSMFSLLIGTGIIIKLFKKD